MEFSGQGGGFMIGNLKEWGGGSSPVGFENAIVVDFLLRSERGALNINRS